MHVKIASRIVSYHNTVFFAICFYDDILNGEWNILPNHNFVEDCLLRRCRDVDAHVRRDCVIAVTNILKSLPANVSNMSKLVDSVKERLDDIRVNWATYYFEVTVTVFFTLFLQLLLLLLQLVWFYSQMKKWSLTSPSWYSADSVQTSKLGQTLYSFANIAWLSNFCCSVAHSDRSISIKKI